MADDTSPSSETNSLDKPLSAAVRKRLQKYFEYGQDKQAKKDHDYAHSMYAQCVVADPANLVYVEAMLNNLTEKHKPKKKKAKIRSSRNAFKKAKSEKDWKATIAEGVELLKENPWDLTTLRGMAEASAGMRKEQDDERFNEIELRYLRTALDGNSKDIDLNRHCAESLARMGQFDQAIACWHRLEELLPGKGEAPQRISELTVLKNMKASGLLDEEGRPKEQAPATKPATAQPQTSSASSPSSAVEKDPRAQLEQAIVQAPTKVSNYLELAKLHESRGELQEAEGILRRALSVSGNEMKIAEHLEAVQVRRAKLQLARAEKQYAARKDSESQQQVLRMKEELNRLELGIYQARAERYPQDVRYRYELAIRLKRAKNYREAIKYFEEAAAEAKLAASARVQQGECFQQLRRYQEAMHAYQASVKLSRGEAGDVEKLALYRAGALAMGLKNWILAQDLLQKLLKIAPDYLDAAARLDKLQKMEETQ